MLSKAIASSNTRLQYAIRQSVPEVGVVFYFRITDFEEQPLAAADNLLADHGVEHSVDILRQIFEEQRTPFLNALQHLHRR